MVVVSVIKLSGLEGAKRIDAEYYQPEYLETVEKLKSLPTVRLKKIAFITDGEHGSPIFDDTSGILYFSAQHVRDGYIDAADAKFISKIIDERNRRSRLNVDDVLLSTVGTIGFAGVVTKKVLPANIDRHVARIAVEKSTIDPVFLAVFLNSKYGRVQTIREATGGVQLNLFIAKIRELLIPVFEHKEIAQLGRNALHLIDESELLYSQAENLLLEELGLKDFKPKYELSYTTNLSKIGTVHRMDAEYFQPAYDKVVEKILNYKNGNTQLLACVENVESDFDPTKCHDHTFSYVELADIDASIGAIHSVSKIKGRDAPSRARRVLRKNDVIVSSVEGSLEKVALVRREFEGALASTGFFQFRPVGIHPEALLVLSKSIILQAQLKKECAGTILTAVPNKSLKRILIPILPDKVQLKIASLVQQSHEARKKAKELLEEVKRKVEKSIEKRAKS